MRSDDLITDNEDGSVTIYLRRENPRRDRAADRLPTPSGPPYVILRACAPGRAMIEALERPEADRPPVVEAVE